LLIELGLMAVPVHREVIAPIAAAPQTTDGDQRIRVVIRR